MADASIRGDSGLVPSTTTALTRSRAARRFRGRQPIKHRLVTPAEEEAVAHLFTSTLDTRDLSWPAALDIGDVDLVPFAVRGRSYEVGLCVNLPSLIRAHDLRTLPLNDFGEIIVGALISDKEIPGLDTLLELIGEATRGVIAAQRSPAAEPPRTPKPRASAPPSTPPPAKPKDAGPPSSNGDAATIAKPTPRPKRRPKAG